MVFRMPDPSQSLVVDRIMRSASDAAAPQISRIVDIGINGILNAVLGQTREEKSNEMNEFHDHLMEIVNKNPIASTSKPMVPQLQVSPRQRIENDIRESNDHIANALEELKKARELSKCSVCRGTLEDTIDFVSAATGEITDASEKVLAMQKLKDTGEIPHDAKWDDLTQKQKKLVTDVVKAYHPVRVSMEDDEDRGYEEEVEGKNGKQIVRSKPKKQRTATKRKKK